MTPEDFSFSIVDCYTPGTYAFKIFEKIKAPRLYPILKCYTTISAVNLSRLDLTIDSLTDLSSLIIDNMKDYGRTITKTRSKVREYGKLYRKYWFLPSKIYSFHVDTLGYNCFIDLYDFAEKIKDNTDEIELKNACEDLINSPDHAIIANNALPTDASHGLSIYFPERKCQYDVSIWKAMDNPEFWDIPVSYEELEFSKDSQWDEFIRMYLKI